jgi:hypothetical protein
MGFELTQAMQSRGHQLVVLGADPQSQLSSILVEADARGLTPTETATEVARERINRACSEKLAERPGLTTARSSQ